MPESLDRLPRYVTVVSRQPAIRARARAELVSRFQYVFACAPESLEELTRAVKTDVIVFVGPEANAVRRSVEPVLSASRMAGRHVLVVDDPLFATGLVERALSL
jgi:hypothetical protein